MTWAKGGRGGDGRPAKVPGRKTLNDRDNGGGGEGSLAEANSKFFPAESGAAFRDRVEIPDLMRKISVCAA